MRFLAEVHHYVATQDPSGVQLQQFTPAEVRAVLGNSGEVGLSVRTGYPFDGKLSIVVAEPGRGPWALSVRRQAWCSEGPTLLLNGAPVAGAPQVRPG